MIEPVPHQAIYRRWRAQTFGQIVGQEAVVETLRNAVRTGRVSHAVLFVGPRGTGKTSLARILAKAINCTNLQDGDACDACPSCVSIREGRAMDLIEIDAASNRGIDAIRELRDRINYAPTDLRRKVYILDEAHQITRDAWNALLKSLEEPPDFVAFMFASTHPQEFPPAILSRLQRFDVRRLTVPEIEGKLARILDADGRVATPEALHLIARLAAGGMRDAESMLDQLLASSSETIDEPRVRDLLGLADAESIDAFVDALAGGDVVAGIGILEGLEERGRDLRAFLDQVIEALRETIIGSGRHAAISRHAISTLVGVARRLATIDPSRSGVGGLRLQLELTLFAEPGTAVAQSPAVPRPSAAAPAPERKTGPVAPAISAPVETTDEAPAPTAVESKSPARKGRPAVPNDPTDDDAAAASERQAPLKSTPADVAKPEASKGTKPETPSIEAPHPETLQAPPVGGDLATLRDHWPEIVARISLHPPTKPLIVACRPVSVEDGVVILGFPEDQAFLRAVAERRRTVLEEGIGAVLGRTVAVRCVATNLDLVPEVETDAEAEFVLAEARRIFGDDAADTAEVH